MEVVCLSTSLQKGSRPGRESDLLVMPTMKEREEAARVFGAGAEAPAATFEPDEELAQAEEAAAVVAAPVPTKGPTAEQLTAIKVHASSLLEIPRLMDALDTCWAVNCNLAPAASLRAD